MFFIKRTSVKSQAVDAIESEIAALDARREKLEDKWQSAREAQETAVAERRALIAATDIGYEELESADFKIMHAERSLANINDAMSLLDEQIAWGERRLMEERDRIARQEELARIDQILNEAEQSAAQLSGAFDEYAGIMTRLGSEGRSCAELARNCQATLLHGSVKALEIARAYRQCLAEGRGPLPPQSRAVPSLITEPDKKQEKAA